MNYPWLPLAEELIRVPSESNNEAQCSKALECVRAHLHDTTGIAERPFEHEGVHSSLWHHEATAKPTLLLFAHLDVVSAPEQLYTPRIEHNRLLGRGAYDMKGPAAVLVHVFKTLVHDHPNLGLLLTTDEEVGGHKGADQVLLQEFIQPDFVVLPDGGPNFTVVKSQKGIIWAKLRLTGLSAHASMPEKGINAIELMMQKLAELKEACSATKGTTICLANMEGTGPAFNAVADACNASLDIRTPDTKAIMQVLQQQFTSTELEIVQCEPSFCVDTNTQTFKNYGSIVHSVVGHTPEDIDEAGGSDARFFSEYNVPVLLSTVDGGDHHTPNEWVSIESLEQYKEVLTLFVQQYFA